MRQIIADMKTVIPIYLKILLRSTITSNLFVFALVFFAAFIMRIDVILQPAVISLLLYTTYYNQLFNLLLCKDFQIRFFHLFPARDAVIFLGHNISVSLFLSIVVCLLAGILALSGAPVDFSPARVILFFLLSLIPMLALGNILSMISILPRLIHHSSTLNILKALSIYAVIVLVYYSQNKPITIAKLLIVFLGQLAAHSVILFRILRYFKANRALLMEGIWTY